VCVCVCVCARTRFVTGVQWVMVDIASGSLLDACW
jgi:hypothetical protein